MAKQRQVRIEQGLPQNLMEEMQDRTDEQLESETKHRSIALALLGARAAERYDAAAARTYFQRAIAASRPQERMQVRRMADASLALAERRADDLKTAVEKLGGEAPSGRALMGLRLMGLIVPPPGGSVLLRIRGFAILAVLVIAVVAAGLGVVEVIALFFGGIGLAPALLLGLLVVGVALAVLAWFGRRRQKAARAGGRMAGPGKGSPPARGPSAGRAPGSARSKGAASGKGAGSAPAVKAPAPAKGSGRGSAQGAGTAKPAATGSSARRGGAPRAAGSAKGAPPAKPAKGAAPARGGAAKGSSRPKRPSR